MKVAFRGALAVAACYLVTVFNFALFEVWLILALFLAKYAFGEGAFLFVNRFCTIYDNFLQRAYFSWVCGVLQFVLDTRIAYTVVDGEGPTHLEQHYTTPVKGTETFVDLDKVLRPPSTPGKAKIIIMNHHCRLDWLYMFIFFSRTRAMVQHIRFVLKTDLRQLPVVGWTMEMFRYIFLSRNWENDEKYIRRMIEFYNATADTPVLFIFPEGTDLSASNVERSQNFAAKSGLPKFHHVLNPRTTGLVAIMKMLGGAEKVEEIWDLTIGYTYHAPGERPSEASIVSGRPPKKAHLLLNRYVVANTEAAQQTKPQYIVPTEEAALAAWTHERFAEKEQLLSRFAATNPVGFDAADVKAVLGKDVGLRCYDEDEVRVQHPTWPRWRVYFQQIGLFGTVLVPLYWLGLPLCCFFLVRWWVWLPWTVAVMVGCAKGVKAIGGLEQALFLTRVPPEKTVMQRLRQFLESRRAKERKED